MKIINMECGQDASALSVNTINLIVVLMTVYLHRCSLICCLFVRRWRYWELFNVVLKSRKLRDTSCALYADHNEWWRCRHLQESKANKSQQQNSHSMRFSLLLLLLSRYMKSIFKLLSTSCWLKVISTAPGPANKKG